MPQRRSSLFLHVSASPNPNTNPTLWEHRLRQRRPVSRNPFEEEPVPSGGYGNTVIESPAIQSDAIKFDDAQADSSREEPRPNGNYDAEWGEQVPGWLNLFFDLAWTATFSSLTSNNKFRDPWDSISYIAFFITAWWLWVAQVSYNVDFYTDDWFHLLFVFLQLLIFGTLAATTRGYDVTNYILHSPGSSELEPYDIMTIRPDRYAAEHLTKTSLWVITFVVALSRILLLVQHIRVVIYAKLSSKHSRLPRRLLIVPASLILSAGLFVAAFMTAWSDWGRHPDGAKVKYACWGSAILVEIIAHVIRFQLDVNKGIRLRSHGSVTGRLSDITTILLGEGLNAIAGTFYAIEQAPGFSAPTGSAVVCCAIIVFFLAYLYFEGAAPLKSVRRRCAWIMMHLPWLLSVILLLEESAPAFANETSTAFVNEITKVWYLKIQLSATLNTYLTFMDNDTIPDAVYFKIRRYQNDYNYTLEDIRAAVTGDSPELPHYGQYQQRSLYHGDVWNHLDLPGESQPHSSLAKRPIPLGLDI
ncbi:unnamed protein product [Rhizoctonia solani]|uniref:Uncharacterized protein n=1 Tax=Rhizoctonia solani TaxID=456999 RepID=A0A8H2Y624_9AGAM|nr:unnamed protein product [Rhizoctonia solani]